MATNTPKHDGKQTTALVLSGGGSKGAYQAGVLEVLSEAGFTYEAISGVSVGSLNGAMLATDQLGELIKVWQNITPGQVLRKHSLVSLARQYLTYKIGIGAPPVSRYNHMPLKQLMQQHLINRSISIPFHFGYVQLESGKYIQAVIRQSDGHVIDQSDLNRVLASTAIPVYFNPVHIDDSTDVDGGLRNISPIKEVLPYEPDRVIIVPTQPVDKEPAAKELRDILDIAFRSINIMLDEIFHGDIDRFLAINRLAKQAEAENLTLTKSDGMPYKYIKPIIIDPKASLGDGLDFSNQRVREMLDLGRKRAREVLDKVEG
ncbi:MAG TPA: patatin-like phospholipase family protein [Balneolaceae bacterium]|nr:patatin-like phospholipase family protein [Balneolaceae bacterium]